jgi:hypothetical protein
MDKSVALKTREALHAISSQYSNHHFKSKNLLGMLENYERFTPDEDFELLNPVLDISSKEIANFMGKIVKQAYQIK